METGSRNFWRQPMGIAVIVLVTIVIALPLALVLLDLAIGSAFSTVFG